MFVEMGISAAGNKSTPARSWRQALRSAIRDAHSLCTRLGLDPAALNLAADGPSQFPVFVPEEFLARMEPGNPADPLLRQVLPLAAEDQSWPGFGSDPLEEAAATLVPGLLHKYHGRALLIVTGVCAVHCRYCFRRHFPYAEVPVGRGAWQPALDALAADPSIEEVLLSGGDPLMVADETLEALVADLAAIPHLKRLRVHTRLPIMIPQRVTGRLLSWLSDNRLQSVVVLHANHPAELDAAVAVAAARLKAAGVLLFNQAVLLRGVNDNVDTLAQLSLRLIELGIVPYYLHQLDRVAGAAHFEVPLEAGQALVEQLRARLPGYAMPRYVQERPGEPSKTPLA
jgi:EF-P beta-lysylation protein EpmB